MNKDVPIPGNLSTLATGNNEKMMYSPFFVDDKIRKAALTMRKRTPSVML